jgi:hemoglobin-like flavoprotein
LDENWVGDALLTTLAEILDEQWNDDVAQAWQQAYAAIAGLMCEGMAAASADAISSPAGSMA